ncbi:hypothetical protein ABZ484_30000 [Streptomyces sp. NPDC006393]|uniref:hypothetical protein n=1 Tax=Streptomyces sp. NPDC006393 TaxID=3156763 RepID=UPI0033FE6DED
MTDQSSPKTGPKASKGAKSAKSATSPEATKFPEAATSRASKAGPKASKATAEPAVPSLPRQSASEENGSPAAGVSRRRLLGTAGATGLAEQMNVRSSTRATSEGSEAA